MTRSGRHWCTPLAALLMTAVTAACVVDTSGIENTVPIDQHTAAPPVFEPTAIPEPTAASSPTAVAEPIATPAALGPPPLPTAAPEAEFEPTAVGPGLVVVPVRGARFILAETHPILQLGGHTLIYVDDERNAEVDIFIPAAAADGSVIDSYEVLITYLESAPALAGLVELSPVSIASFPTRVFEGTANSADRAFITEVATVNNNQLGWFPPARMRLWVINHPDGPVIVSAESLENPGRYSDAARLATEILSTIDFS
jgi:hypothetical protein